MEDGINKFIGRMTHMHEVTLAGNTLLHTGKLEPIDMRVTVRSGGKKVKTTSRKKLIHELYIRFSNDIAGNIGKQPGNVWDQSKGV